MSATAAVRQVLPRDLRYAKQHNAPRGEDRISRRSSLLSPLKKHCTFTKLTLGGDRPVDGQGWVKSWNPLARDMPLLLPGLVRTCRKVKNQPRRHVGKSRTNQFPSRRVERSKTARVQIQSVLVCCGPGRRRNQDMSRGSRHASNPRACSPHDGRLANCQRDSSATCRRGGSRSRTGNAAEPRQGHSEQQQEQRRSRKALA